MPFVIRKAIEPPAELRFGGSSAASSRPGYDTTLLQDITMPAANGDVVAQVADSSQFMIGQRVFVSPLGFLDVVAKT